MSRRTSFIPRKIRTVTTARNKTQYLLSIPPAIAKSFDDDDVFMCTIKDGCIVFAPIADEREETDAA